MVQTKISIFNIFNMFNMFNLFNVLHSKVKLLSLLGNLLLINLENNSKIQIERYMRAIY